MGALLVIMAASQEHKDEASSEDYTVCSTTSPPLMDMIKFRNMLYSVWGFSTSWRKKRCSKPHASRISHRDAEKDDEFQYATTHQCLSSYYSVFVVRLAIMVTQFPSLSLSSFMV